MEAVEVLLNWEEDHHMPGEPYVSIENIIMDFMQINNFVELGKN